MNYYNNITSEAGSNCFTGRIWPGDQMFPAVVLSIHSLVLAGGTLVL